MSSHFRTSTLIGSMKFSKSKWLTYTFFVGLIPVFTRLLAWAITHAGAVSPLAASDFVYFGLVPHISIINELEYLSSLVLFCRSINFLKSDDVASSFEVGVKMLIIYCMPWEHLVPRLALAVRYGHCYIQEKNSARECESLKNLTISGEAS